MGMYMFKHIDTYILFTHIIHARLIVMFLDTEIVLGFV